MNPRKPLRLWPGVAAVVLQWLARFGIKAVVPGFRGFAWSAQGGLIGAVAVVVWWVFFSRAAWAERLGAIVLMIAAMGATWGLRHESMGPFWVVAYAIPVLCLAFVVSAVASRRLADGPRRATMIAAIVLACGVWTLVRTEGITGDHVGEFAWRWSKTPEEKVLGAADASLDAARDRPLDGARSEPLDVARGRPTSLPPAPAAPKTAAGPGVTPVEGPAMSERGVTRVEGPAMSGRGVTPVEGPAMSERGIARVEWPGFRGPRRDGVIHGVRIETNWSASPPVELWRRPIGPGWSSFAVAGNFLYTQEQRGDEEVVACYDATTGRPVWTHRDAARFFESNAGAGPRATPTISGGRVYTFGATGLLNALDAGDGTVVWSRNVTSDNGPEVPYWGFSSSPVVADGRVVVAAAGQLLAYDAATGDPRWSGKAGEGYSSPHLATIEGVAQVLLMSGSGATSVAPADGKVLWHHPWGGSPIVQPAVTADGGVLIVATPASGTRRLAVAHGPAGWTVEERWTSPGLKPYFNDFVVHKGHAFGFDGRILSSIDLEDGQRKWKGGRYGNGQLVVLPEQDLLLVLSEDGELALVKATPDQFTELARIPAIEGKTWNHPVIVGDRLFVRNGREMAAFRLPLAGR
jgi:outer membrane protein assembly factor BamB